MSEYSTDDWTPFRVGKRSTKKNWTEPSCQLLSSVSHVTHVRQALDVLRGGQVTPQLIYDKSRLNTDRILVVWLSPNDWGNAGGFRYGNVALDLKWEDLVAGKRYYWVGAMTYKPVACRILITDQNRDGQLKPYDPAAGDGPWWHDVTAGNHYWNGDYCLEFMLEAPVNLDKVQSLRFVTHHPVRCSIDPSSCPDRNQDGQVGGARLLSGACAAGVLRPLLWLTSEDTPTSALESAWRELRHRISVKIDGPRGAVEASATPAAALARSVLGAVGEWRKDERRELVSLFKTNEDAVEASATLIERALGLAAGTLPRADEDDD